MKTTIILILILLSLNINAQHLFPTHFEGCNTSLFSLEGKEMYAQKNSDDLLKEITNGLDAGILKKAKGMITFQVLVDTLGAPCLLSAQNELKGKIKAVDFKTIIDTQTTWTCPMDEGNKVMACVLVQLIFDKKEIVLKRIGFNSKLGRIELSRVVMKK